MTDLFIPLTVLVGASIGSVLFLALRESVPAVVLLPTMLIFITVLPVLARSFRRDADIFAPIHLIAWSYALLYVIAPILIVVLDIRFIPHIGDPDESLSRALFYTFVSLLMLYWGYWSRVGAWLATPIPPLRTVTIGRIQIFALLYGAIGLVCYFVFLYLAGGFYNFFSNVGMRVNFSSGKGYLSWGVFLLIPAVTLWFTSLLLKGKQASLLNRLLFILFFLVVVTFFVTLGNRSRVLLCFFFPAMVYYYLKSSFTISTAVMVGALFFLIAGGPLHWLRSTSGEVRMEPGRFVEVAYYDRLPRLIEDLAKNLTYVDILAGTLEHFPEPNNYQWGKTFAALLLAPLPRSLFPEIKPYGAATMVTQILFPHQLPPDPTDPLGSQSYSGVIPTLTGELYLNFALPGVVIGMFLYGALLRCLYTYFTWNRQNPGSALFYAFVCYGLVFQLPLGDFVGAMALTLFFAIPTVLVVPFTKGSIVANSEAPNQGPLLVVNRG